MARGLLCKTSKSWQKAHQRMMERAILRKIGLASPSPSPRHEQVEVYPRAPKTHFALVWFLLRNGTSTGLAWGAVRATKIVAPSHARRQYRAAIDEWRGNGKGTDQTSLRRAWEGPLGPSCTDAQRRTRTAATTTKRVDEMNIYWGIKATRTGETG